MSFSIGRSWNDASKSAARAGAAPCAERLKAHLPRAPRLPPRTSRWLSSLLADSGSLSRSGRVVRKVFDDLDGVANTRVGYTGGANPKPSYGSVCEGDGHTEAVRVEYNPKEVSYKELLDAYWDQYVGPAAKCQYKSAIWVSDAEQKALAEESVQKAHESGRYAPLPVRVPVEPVRDWHDAEEYHQHHMKKVWGVMGRS
eukprot:s5717_g1.t1